MSEKLTPKVGDRVRFEHSSGDTFSGTLKNIEHGTSTGNTYYNFVAGVLWDEREGWKIVEVIQNPFPPKGTLVKGVLDLGDGEEPFVGCSTGTPDRPFQTITEDGLAGKFMARHFKSWEVVS